MGARSMTVSTVGLVSGIRRLADEPLPINLAISLHAPDDTLRSELMPINRRYPIAALLDATREYIARTNRRVSFEYVLLQGKNDLPEQAIALAELLQGMLCHVNLIPWNPVPGAPLGRSERARAAFPAGATRPRDCVHSARRARIGDRGRLRPAGRGADGGSYSSCDCLTLSPDLQPIYRIRNGYNRSFVARLHPLPYLLYQLKPPLPKGVFVVLSHSPDSALASAAEQQR